MQFKTTMRYITLHLIRLGNISKLGNASVGPDKEIREIPASPVGSAGRVAFLDEVMQTSQ